MVYRAFAVGMTFLLCTACGEKVDDQPGFGPGGGSMGSESTTGADTDTDGMDTDSATTGDSGSTSGGGTTTGATTSGSTTGPGTSSTSSTTGNTSNTGGGACGNGTIDAGEQCDGADLNGFDCTSLGYSGGTLSCDAVTCTFDTQLCMSGTSGTSG